MLGRKAQLSVVKGVISRCVRNFSGQDRVGILGVPFGKGQKEEGAKRMGLELAPDAIRGTRLIKELKNLGYNVRDFGNVSYEPIPSLQIPEMHNFGHVVANNIKVSEQVREVLNDDRICLTLGGDHSIFTGSVHAHLQHAGPENVAVLYIDAHADINTGHSSPSGNIHGMSIAMIAQEMENDWSGYPNLEWIQSRLPLKNLGYIGLRSVDPAEVDIIAKYGIAAYGMRDVVRYGIHDVLTRCLERIDPEKNKTIHLSIDTDSLDPIEAPSTTLPERGGLFLRDLIYITETISRTNRIGAVDWVELNPLLGSEMDQKRTLEACCRALIACFESKVV